MVLYWSRIFSYLVQQYTILYEHRRLFSDSWISCVGNEMVLQLIKPCKYDFYCFNCPGCGSMVEVAVVHRNGTKTTYTEEGYMFPPPIVKMLQRCSNDNLIMCIKCSKYIRLSNFLKPSLIPDSELNNLDFSKTQ